MSADKSDERCTPFGSTEENKYYRRKGVVFDSTFVTENTLDAIENLEVRNGDIFIGTVPRSGTHWLIEMVFLIVADANPAKVNRAAMDQVLETAMRSNPNLSTDPGYKVIANWPSSRTRVIATHLSAEFLPQQVWHTKDVKVLTMARNPLDIFVSQHKLLGFTFPEVVREWPDFIQYNMTDDVIGGSWFHHVMSYWSKQLQFKDHVLLLKYEDAHRDLRRTVQAIAEFLQRPLSEDQTNRMVELTSFGGMVQTYKQLEKSEADNVYRTRMSGATPFLDKGKVGSWKGKYNDKQLEEIKSKMRKSFGGTGLDIDLKI